MGPGDTVGGYEIVRREAAGGCGVVYEGRSAAGARVAIKVMIGESERTVRRFEREATLLASFSHPHIVGYLDHGFDGEVRYLIEEWVEGRSLTDELADPGLTLAEAVEMARQVGSALATAHANGVVHRDIKPGNLLREHASKRMLVLDFGIARDLADQQRLTRTGALLGTVGYMAPEQARADKDIRPAADIFALGCVLYEALTGRPAFAGLNRVSIRAKILMADPPPVDAHHAEAPKELVALVREMLAKSAEDRPKDGAAVLERLAALPPMPESNRRPLDIVETATLEMPIKLAERSELTSLVLSCALDHLAGSELEVWRERLRQAVSGFPGRPWVLEDGALVFAPPPVEDGPELAARAALAAKAAIPALAISVVSTKRGDPKSDTIERAATALERETVHNIFAEFSEPGAAEGVIAIDEATAERLPSQFTVTRSGKKLFLCGYVADHRGDNGD